MPKHSDDLTFAAPRPAGVGAALAGLARRPGLWAGLGLLAAAGYGYAMANPSIDMDDLALENYQQGGEFLRQGRFTVWLLQAATGIMRYQRFLPELFFALGLLLAGVVLAAALYTAAGRAPALPGALLLGGGLLLWPYHAEILIYSNQCGVGLGYLLCAAGLALALPHILGGWRAGLPGAAGAAVCLALALGLYESFAPVWLTLLFALLLTAATAAPRRSRPARRVLGGVLRGLWPLAAALVLRGGVAALLRAVMGVTGENGTSSATIYWFRRASLKEALVIPLREWLTCYVARAFGTPALALLALGCGALVLWAAVRRWGNGAGLCAAGLLLSQFSLGILQGTGAQMARASQCFAVFVPFVAWLLLAPALDGAGVSRARRGAAALLALALLLAEGASLTAGIRLGRDRWGYEKGLLEDAAAEIAALDPTGTLPVVFTGTVEMPPALEARAAIPAGNPAYTAAWAIARLLGGPQGTLYRYENPTTLVINWAMTAFGSHEQLYRVMEALGHDYARPTPDQQAAGDALGETLSPGVSLQEGYLLVVF